MKSHDITEFKVIVSIRPQRTSHISENFKGTKTGKEVKSNSNFNSILVYVLG